MRNNTGRFSVHDGVIDHPKAAFRLGFWLETLKSMKRCWEEHVLITLDNGDELYLDYDEVQAKVAAEHRTVYAEIVEVAR